MKKLPVLFPTILYCAHSEPRDGHDKMKPYRCPYRAALRVAPPAGPLRRRIRKDRDAKQLEHHMGMRLQVRLLMIGQMK